MLPWIVIGGGVSGLAAAWMLHQRGESFVLLESEPRLGGHACTVDAKAHGGSYPVDVGFIVCNRRTYPRFLAWMEALGVPLIASSMSLSVAEEASGIEWNGEGLSTVFGQRSNLLRPSHWRMLQGILRFHRIGQALKDAPADETFGAWIARHRIPRVTVERYLMPMTAAIWSSPLAEMERFPARLLGAFLDNHGMLQVDERPKWLTVAGGSRTYVNALAKRFGSAVRLASPVAGVVRHADHVEVRLASGETLTAAKIVVAAHADLALKMLGDPSATERDVLGAFPYRANAVGLHTDPRFMPKRARLHAAWNVQVPAGRDQALRMTYDMRRLQGIAAPGHLLVALNGAIPGGEILHRTTFHHPVFSVAGQQAQGRLAEINGVNRTFYCGAYWGFGFHEDGVASAVRALEREGFTWP